MFILCYNSMLIYIVPSATSKFAKASLNEHQDFWPDTKQKSSALIWGKIKPSAAQHVSKTLLKLSLQNKFSIGVIRYGGGRRVLDEEEIKATWLSVWRLALS